MGEKDIHTLLNDAREKSWSDQALVQRAVDMARELSAPTLNRLNSEERSFLAALSRLVTDEPSRRFAEQLCEYALRDSAHAAERLRHMLDELGGIPTFFSSMARLRLKAVAMASRGMQGAALGEMKRIFRATFGEPVLPAVANKISRRADALSKEGLRLILTPLEPEVFGEQAARQYAESLAALLVEQPRVGIVVQSQRLCPGLSPASPRHSAELFAARLKRFITASLLGGGARPIIVETHCSDTLPLVVEGLKQALDSPECDTADVALELPGYLRSSASILRELVDWGKPRAERGATPLKVLLVKGSYLDEERRISAAYGTSAQLCSSKSEADVAYVRLLNAAMACPPKVITPVVGTHELTHLCYAALRWARSGREGLPPVCLLYGVGNHMARQFARLGAQVALRAPIVPEEGEDGIFERYLLGLVHEFSRPGGFLAEGYAADASGNSLSDKARPLMIAQGDRDESDRAEAAPGYVPGHLGALLERPYVDAFYEAARAEKEREQSTLPLVIGGQAYASPLTFVHRSLTVPGLVDYRFSCADYKAVDMALHYAQTRLVSPRAGEVDRAAGLLKAARELRRRSTEFAALLVRDAGFTLPDAQAELRDAIDSARYYATAGSLKEGLQDGSTPQPLGVVAVAVGAAHPLAEAMAGIAAAWAGGNIIVYKPAAYSTLLGIKLTELLRDAGVEMICLPCMDNEISARLITDSRVDAVVCAADDNFARALTARHPLCAPLVAPVAGSCVYLAESCDWRTALREVLAVAYRRSGSSPACPLCVAVHARVYDDPAFAAALRDAVESLETKPTWLEGADLGPIASPLVEAERLLLAEGSPGVVEKLVAPSSDTPGSLLWRPGVYTASAADADVVRYGRRLPLLRLLRVESAEQAFALRSLPQACSRFAIYSADAEEIAALKSAPGCRWLAINCLPVARAGALPVPTCRSTLSAACGPMVGGRNFAPALCRWQETARPSMRSARRNLVFDPKGVIPSTSGAEETMRLSAAADSISYWWEKEFSAEQALQPLPGHRARLSYRPIRVCLRIEKAMADADVAIALMAAMQAGCRLQISTASVRPWLALFAEQYGVGLSVQKRGEFEESLAELPAGIVLRDPAATDDSLARAAAAGLAVSTAPVLANGRLELLQYLEERLVICPE